MIIAGAGGHALEVLDVLVECGFKTGNIYFFEERSLKLEKWGIKVVSAVPDILRVLAKDDRFCLGVGNPLLRVKFYTLLKNLGATHYPVISPHAYISPYAKNNGADIMAFSFISSSVELGIGALINTGVKVHHESLVGDFAELSPNSVLLGKAQVGDYSSIGASACVLPEKKIGDHAIVGASAVVTKDVKNNEKVKGVPAKKYD